jgi:hypothetical protein
VEQLFKWAEKADEPLRTYATGLLAGAMELQDVAANFKEKNSALVLHFNFDFEICIYSCRKNKRKTCK